MKEMQNRPEKNLSEEELEKLRKEWRRQQGQQPTPATPNRQPDPQVDKRQTR